MFKAIETKISCEPIGIFLNKVDEKYMAPKQGVLGDQNKGKIYLSKGRGYEQALEDLEGFERVWVVYWFHLNDNWKPKVNTPRGGKKRGVFGTRSPHRPNPIGLSCCRLVKVKGLELTLEDCDLLNGTPILDIKPYITYADCFPGTTQGWLDKVEEKDYMIQWSKEAVKQIAFIESLSPFPLKNTVELRLKYPFPLPGNRIRQNGEDFRIAIKTWRLDFSVKENVITIEKVSTGYDQATLKGEKKSRWDDVPLHVAFQELF